ncbi:hypothetical protein CROQUDRAFT_659264 [Cronartium quercuum f. sp. fusiforme G11]|uniref:Hexosyltransferase n=1 Tax=Cronartium quercuum f. sp. fusiforme G11 TaxID=708437 RepID=A0A9P6NDW5_9BASI|nr:hypothetical protein CROQUDRAFT_659264 [Cronartium quercuum f. sp. fusiforme G11]
MKNQDQEKFGQSRALHTPHQSHKAHPNRISHFFAWAFNFANSLAGYPRRQDPGLLPSPGSHHSTSARSSRFSSRVNTIFTVVIFFGSVYVVLSWILDQPNTLQLDPVIDPVTFQILPAGDPLHQIRSTTKSPTSKTSAATAALQLELEQRQADFHLRIQHAVNRNITKAWRALKDPSLAILHHSGPDRNHSDAMAHFLWYKGDEALKRNRPASQFKCDVGHRKQGSLLFLGVFTTPEGFAKRNLIRTLLKTDLPPWNVTQADGTVRIQPLIDLVFVSGQPTNEHWRYLIEEENRLHNDLVVLEDVEDNIDGGKTYAYLKWVALGANGRWAGKESEGGLQDRDPRVRLVGRPRFVMKADDDTFLVIPNLIKAFQDLDCNMNIYWGTSQGSNPLFDPYFRGLGYAMSWPLVEWIGSSNMSAEAQVGIEDARVGAWLTELNADVDPVTRIDVGWKMGDWNQMEIDETSIGLHWLKAVEWFPMAKFKILAAWKRAGQNYRWDWHVKSGSRD